MSIGYTVDEALEALQSLGRASAQAGEQFRGFITNVRVFNSATYAEEYMWTVKKVRGIRQIRCL